LGYLDSRLCGVSRDSFKSMILDTAAVASAALTVA